MQTENQQNRVKEEPSFSYYENLFQLHAGKNLSLTEVYNQIAGPGLRHATGEVRRAIAEGKPERGKELKMQLPAIAVSCRFPEERRTEQAGPYTGYVLVDSDNLTCPAAEYRDRCAALPFVALAHVSAGGNGVHLLARVATSVEDHVAVCRSLQQFIETAYESRQPRLYAQPGRVRRTGGDGRMHPPLRAAGFRGEGDRQSDRLGLHLRTGRTWV